MVAANYSNDDINKLFSTAGQKDGLNEGKSKAAVNPPLCNVGPVKAADKPMQDVFYTDESIFPQVPTIT